MEGEDGWGNEWVMSLGILDIEYRSIYGNCTGSVLKV